MSRAHRGFTHRRRRPWRNPWPGAASKRQTMTFQRVHWAEYVTEAAALSTFMVSATTFATLLQHPASPLSHLFPPVASRLLMGIAMGLTAIALIYSPLGQRSGAHMNPAVTLTFLRLRKISGPDAAAYVSAQFVGGALGVAVALVALGELPADPSVNYIATRPGELGALWAFAGEAAASLTLMLTVLYVSNHPTKSGCTGLAAGSIVALAIVVESPLSGTSLNPARTLGPAMFAGTFDSIWIYFTAPLLGMLAAAEIFVRREGLTRIRCAKLHHPRGIRCIFGCGHTSAPAGTHA